MGEIRASVTLENRDDRGAVRLGLRAETDVRRTTVEGVVDTGAVTLVIPEDIATELGLEHWGTRTVVYADERREEQPVTDVTIEIGDLATRTEAIVGPAGSEILIGQSGARSAGPDRRFPKLKAGAAPTQKARFWPSGSPPAPARVHPRVCGAAPPGSPPPGLPWHEVETELADGHANHRRSPARRRSPRPGRGPRTAGRRRPHRIGCRGEERAPCSGDARSRPSRSPHSRQICPGSPERCRADPSPNLVTSSGNFTSSSPATLKPPPTCSGATRP